MVGTLSGNERRKITTPSSTIPSGPKPGLSNASSADELRVSIVDDGGATTTVLLEEGAANDDDAAWASASIALDAWAGTRVRVRIQATDGAAASLVEAAVDDVRVTRS